MLYSEYGENIAVLSSDIMLLIRVTIFLDKLFGGEFSIIRDLLEAKVLEN